MRRTATTPGSAAGGSYPSTPSFSLKNCHTRPGNGETRRAFACAAATACANPKSSVMLHVMPSVSNTFAAWMPSHVPATLTRTRRRGTPAASYISMMRRARRSVSSTSNDARMSTSVLTYPGTMRTISRPSSTASRSIANEMISSSDSACDLAYSTALSTKVTYRASPDVPAWGGLLPHFGKKTLASQVVSATCFDISPRFRSARNGTRRF
mmetsp:Transcript_22504/g.89358  ORF Transcript_22504/g.89358 Transcript_22504/m.89358 type:complete len:211 (-) Transcript_22504:361-993(-)